MIIDDWKRRAVDWILCKWWRSHDKEVEPDRSLWMNFRIVAERFLAALEQQVRPKHGGTVRILDTFL